MMKKFSKFIVVTARVLVISLLAGIGILAVPNGDAEPLYAADSAHAAMIETDIDFSVDDSAKNVSVSTNYSDWFFGREATVYNHNLARVSAVLSAAAYEAPDNVGQEKFGSNRRVYNIYNAVEKLEFGNIVSYNYDDSYFTEMSSKGISDKCGFVLAEKTVCLDAAKPDDVSRIVLVAIRGTSVEEWFGNFNIVEPGSGDYETKEHYSFKTAEVEIKKALDAYLAEHKGDENLKIWITGHSRGAAVGNMLAAEITDDGFAKKENIYAYTFATPNGTRDAYNDLMSGQTKYGNIWNIVNPEDFVPYLAFSFDGWNFGKWGNTLYLPDKVVTTDKARYETLLATTSANRRKITGEPYYTYPRGYLDTYEFILDTYSIGTTVKAAYGKVDGQRVSLVGYFNSIADFLAHGNVGIAVQIALDIALKDRDEITKKFAEVGTFIANNALNKKMSQSHEPETYIAWMNSIEARDMARELPVFRADGQQSDDLVSSESGTEDIRTSFGSIVSQWAKEEMEKAYKNGLVPVNFENDDLTDYVARDEFATIAVTYFEKILGQSVSTTENPFVDIDGSEHKESVVKAYAAGITKGIGEDIFAPDSNITREQAAVMLMRTAELLGFDTQSVAATEDTVSEWAKQGVGFVTERKIMNGTGSGFEPLGTYTKEQAFATFLRMFDNLR